MYIFKKNMLHLYIKYIYILYKLYKYIHVNIFKIYAVCVCIYIHTIHTHILCKQKLLFWMWLITINQLTAPICSKTVVIQMVINMPKKKHCYYTFTTIKPWLIFVRDVFEVEARICIFLLCLHMNIKVCGYHFVFGLLCQNIYCLVQCRILCYVELQITFAAIQVGYG